MTQVFGQEPAFSKPWHAQLFALTVQLSDRGAFTWPEWTNTFGAVLAHHGKSRALNGGDDYFNCWLEALEKMLISRGLATLDQMADIRAAWETAYLHTPHGDPVALG